jgi:hypothetical protein
MCDFCSKLYKSEQHEPALCPVRVALFCSICQIHGHSTIKCPDRNTWHYRKPEFVEQLIPTSILNHYKIDSLTRISSGVNEHIQYIHGDPVITVPNDEKGKNIRATLASHNLPCSSKKEDKRILEEFGNIIGTKIEYSESSSKRIVKVKSKSKTPAKN